MRRKARQSTKAENRPRFWGRHAVAAALANPDREVYRIFATREAASALDFGSIPVTFSDVADLGRMVPRDAPHQGVVAEVERLDDILLAELLDQAEDGRPLVVLDQVQVAGRDAEPDGQRLLGEALFHPQPTHRPADHGPCHGFTPFTVSAPRG